MVLANIALVTGIVKRRQRVREWYGGVSKYCNGDRWRLAVAKSIASVTGVVQRWQRELDLYLGGVDW